MQIPILPAAVALTILAMKMAFVLDVWGVWVVLPHDVRKEQKGHSGKKRGLRYYSMCVCFVCFSKAQMLVDRVRWHHE